MGISGLSAEDVRGALHDLEQLGIASNDTVLTAFVHEGVERSSQKRFNEAIELEIALIAQMREAAPDHGYGRHIHPAFARHRTNPARCGGDRPAAGKAMAHSPQHRP